MNGLRSMSSSDDRFKARKKSCIQAFASDLDNTFEIKCIIRDISRSGCKIVTSQVRKLPEFILLVPEGFKQPLSGKIVWRKDKFAGVTFLSKTGDENLSRIQEFIVDDYWNDDEFIVDDHWNCEEEDEPMLLDVKVRPMSYSGRLAKYNRRTK